MKIVVDARIIYTSTGRYVERLLDRLQKIDAANEYVVLLLKKDMDRWVPASANFTKQEADYPPYTLREQINLALLLYRLRPDLVHFTMPQQPLLYFGRHVTTIHDLILIEVVNKRKFDLLKGIYKNHLKPAVFRWVLGRFVSSSKYIITPTNFVKDQLEKRFKVAGNKVIVTYESADTLSAEPSEPDFITDHDRFILYVGNAYPYKNAWRLISAFSKIHQPDLKLILAGKTDFFYEDLERKTAESNIPNVIFTGFIPDGELAWLYQHATIFATASLIEGFGLPGLEAMVYGAPVASSNASCLPEVYGSAAEYFDPNNTEDIAQKLNDLLADPARLADLKQAGAERVATFSWDNMAKETFELYQKAGK